MSRTGFIFCRTFGTSKQAKAVAGVGGRGRLQYIHPKAIKVWRIHGMISAAISFVLFLVLMLLGLFLFRWLLYLAAGFLVIGLVDFLIFVSVIPILRWRFFRYRINETHVVIRDGIWFVKHTVIPMARIQFVEAEQGPLLRAYRLAKLKISTATSTHHIPALSIGQAQKLRDRLAAFIQASDVDV